MRVGNWPLMIETIRQIIAHPDTYNQWHYADETDCGTTYCVAGHAIALSGYDFATCKNGSLDPNHVIIGYGTKLYPASWQDDFMDYLADPAANFMTPGEAGRLLLGLDPDDSEDLFSADKRFGHILFLLEDWAKEDGVEWPDDLKLTPEQRSAVRAYMAARDSEYNRNRMREIELQFLGRER